MIEHFKFVAAHTKRTPKITIPAPSALYGRPTATPIDKPVYPDLDAFFDDLGQAYSKAVRAFADAGCRYLQLDEVFIAMLCDPKYREQMTTRGDDPEKLGQLYGDLINAAMSDIPVRHDDHDASVPRQLQIDLHGRGRLRRRCRGAVRPASTCTAISWNTTPSAPAASSRCGCCRRARGRARPRHHQDRQARKQGRAQAPHRRGGEIRRRSTSSACPANAASPRPRKATR